MLADLWDLGGHLKLWSELFFTMLLMMMLDGAFNVNGYKGS